MTTECYPYRWSMPTEVVLEADCLNRLREFGCSLGRKPLVITGRHSARASGALERVLAQYPGAEVFDAVEENPCDATCDRAAALCRNAGCDMLVAIGGGSPMDVAKAVAGLALNPGACADYFSRERFVNGALPIIAIPTTSGTGSEVTPYSVIIDSATGAKRSIRMQCLFPRVALLDPLLARSMPRSVTANTGLDALSQAMEGMASRHPTPVGDLMALEACRIIRRWLPVAVADGGDAEARTYMLHAAMLSGCIIAQSGTTLVHGMGYLYTTRCGIPHGLANALLLTPLFQFNARHIPGKVAALAEALGFPCAPEPESARAAIGEALHAILSDCGVSPAAKDSGVDGRLLPGFADEVAADPYRFRNQVGELDSKQVQALYEAAQVGLR